MSKIAHIVFQRIAAKIPNLKLKLKQAGMDIKPDELVKRSIMGAFYVAFGVELALFLALVKYGLFKPVLLLLFPVLFISLSMYFLKLPDSRIMKRQKEIGREIVFAGRFLIIELESGVPLYNALVNLSKNYKVLGVYVRQIIDKVDLGTSMETALNEAVELVPSDDFRKLLWQIINSMRTGSDTSQALNSAVDQIAKRQQIMVSEYGKKLNPLAMFYMMIAVIVPSLGMTMIIILSSFVNFTLSLPILMVMAFFLGVVQFMFLSIIKVSRPPVEL